MNKPIYLGQAILCIGKTLMYEFWCDYIKSKYKGKIRLCYTGTDSFIIHVETEDFYEGIADDVERQFDTSNYDENDKRPLPVGINKKALGKSTYPYGMNAFKVCESKMLLLEKTRT